MRNERVRPWFGPVGVAPGVEDRGVARDGETEDDVEGRSRPVTGGFLAAIVDIVERAMWVECMGVYLSASLEKRETKTRDGQKTR